MRPSFWGADKRRFFLSYQRKSALISVQLLDPNSGYLQALDLGYFISRIITLSPIAVTPDQFSTFGELLRVLRRQARITQRELAIAVGYSDTQISRIEQNQRVPDAATITALFVPALHLAREPQWVERLLELARQARFVELPGTTATVTPNNLPASLTTFIGREKEQAEIRQRIGA